MNELLVMFSLDWLRQWCIKMSWSHLRLHLQSDILNIFPVVSSFIILQFYRFPYFLFFPFWKICVHVSVDLLWVGERDKCEGGRKVNNMMFLFQFSSTNGGLSHPLHWFLSYSITHTHTHIQVNIWKWHKIKELDEPDPCQQPEVSFEPGGWHLLHTQTAKKNTYS